jgi:hypothetical protein
MSAVVMFMAAFWAGALFGGAITVLLMRSEDAAG